MNKEQSTFTGKRSSCPGCVAKGNDASGDNLAEYTDHYYCFACGYSKQKGSTVEEKIDPISFSPVRGSVVGLQHRLIDEKTARQFGYETVVSNGKEVEIANYYKDGVLVGQHLRGPNKSFVWRGSSKGVELFGQHLWKSQGGKRLVITEGEIDCMTVCQLLGNTWPVVSIPNGTQSALKAIKDNLEFISGYQEVILCFDNDEPGRAAVQQVASILPPGKCKVVSLPYKDANECLQKGASKAVVSAIWEAQIYSPDEILHISKIAENKDSAKDIKVYPFPFDGLSEFLIGQRSGEITLWASGTGSGKSTLLRELMMHHLEEGRSVGAIMLEESPEETMDDMISLMLNKPVRALRATRMMNELRAKMGKPPINVAIVDDLSDEEYAEARKKLCGTHFYIYDHLGNNALINLLARIEYMAVSLKVSVIVLDHITAAAAGLMGINDKDIEGGNNERIIIDTLMKELRSLVVRTGVRIDIVSQLRKNDKAYEEGDRITLQDLRGSGALSSVPNTVIALERDRQNPDQTRANTTIVRVLKNRLTGKSGIAAAIFYDYKTGRMKEIQFGMSEDGDLVFKPMEE